MREIVGAAAVIDGKAQSISGVRVLGRYRLQIRLTKPVGDFTARLTMPFFCPVLPTHADHRDQRPGRLGPLLRRRASRQPADRAQAQPVLPGRPPRERRPDRVDVRQASRAACVAVEQNRIDYCFPGIRAQCPGALAERYGINRPGGQFFVSPSLWTCLRRVQPRPAGVQRAPARSRSRRRSTTQSTDRSWPVRSATSAASAPTRSSRPRSLARRASTRSKAPTPPPRGSGSHGRRSSRRTLVLYA